MLCSPFIIILLLATDTHAQPKNDTEIQNSVKSYASQIIEHILPFPPPENYYLSKLPSSFKLNTSPLIVINNPTPQRSQPSISGSKKKPFPKRTDFLLKYDLTTKRTVPKRTQGYIASVDRSISDAVPIANDKSLIKYLIQETNQTPEPQITVATVVLNQASKTTDTRPKMPKGYKTKIKNVTQSRDNNVKPKKSNIRPQISANSEQVQDRNNEEETDIEQENESYVKEQQHVAEVIENQRVIENINEKYYNREEKLKHVNEDDQEYQKPISRSQKPENLHQRYKNVYQDHRNLRAHKNEYQASEMPYRATQIDYKEDKVAIQSHEPKKVLRTSYTSDSSEDSDDYDDGPGLRNGETNDEYLNYGLDGLSLRQRL